VIIRAVSPALMIRMVCPAFSKSPGLADGDNKAINVDSSGRLAGTASSPRFC
jgi:hypothetical protein